MRFLFAKAAPITFWQGVKTCSEHKGNEFSYGVPGFYGYRILQVSKIASKIRHPNRRNSHFRVSSFKNFPEDNIFRPPPPHLEVASMTSSIISNHSFDEFQETGHIAVIRYLETKPFTSSKNLKI